MRILSVLSLAAALGASAACGRTTPAEPAAEGEFRPTSTIKEIMDSVVDPSADVLWESVATTIDRTGQTDKMPRTDEDWVTVRRSAVALVEATNLLVIRPRRVAPAGEKSEYPGIELEPEQIQAAVDADRTAWVKHAHDLHDAPVRPRELHAERHAAAETEPAAAVAEQRLRPRARDLVQHRRGIANTFIDHDIVRADDLRDRRTDVIG